MQNFLGHDGFIWWIGVVEDVNDPDTLGRCKVRVFGYHDDSNLIPTADLPWATAIHSPNTQNLYASLSVNDWVFGFFLDSLNAQEPVILGFIPTIKSPRSFNRVNTNGNSSNTICWEIGNNYIEVVKQSTTESNGHITIYHTSGSKINIASNGDVSIYGTNAISVNSNNLIATSNSCNLIIRDNLSATANNITFTANNNFTVNASNVSAVGNTVSISGSSATISDSGSSLTPTAISAGLASGLIYPIPPAE